jgi:hypothetical protein
LARDLRPRSDNAGALPRATSRARGFLADASRFAAPSEPSRAQRLLDARVAAGTARPDARDDIRRQPVWTLGIEATSGFGSGKLIRPATLWQKKAEDWQTLAHLGANGGLHLLAIHAILRRSDIAARTRPAALTVNAMRVSPTYRGPPDLATKPRGVTHLHLAHAWCGAPVGGHDPRSRDDRGMSREVRALA